MRENDTIPNLKHPHIKYICKTIDQNVSLQLGSVRAARGVAPLTLHEISVGHLSSCMSAFTICQHHRSHKNIYFESNSQNILDQVIF